jgi:hypothetical protein
MSTGAVKEETTTSRHPAVALLCVNSSDGELFNPQGFRIDDTTPGDIYINQQTPMMVGYMSRVALTEMNIEWSFPNVYENNNTLTMELYDISGVLANTVRVSVPVDFYSAPKLGRALTTSLNTNANVIALFGANAFKILVGGLPTGQTTDALQAGDTFIATSSNFTILLNTAAAALGYFRIMPYNAVIPGLRRLTDDLTNMMGLTPSINAGLNYYLSYTGGFASMMRTPYIDVVSKFLTKNQNVRDNDSTKQGSKSLLARVYLSNEEAIPREITLTYSSTESPAGSGIYPVVASSDNAFGVKETTFRREFSFPKQILWNRTENIDIVDLQVVDSKGNILRYEPTTVVNNFTLNQNNTSDIQFTLQVSEN